MYVCGIQHNLFCQKSAKNKSCIQHLWSSSTAAVLQTCMYFCLKSLGNLECFYLQPRSCRHARELLCLKLLCLSWKYNSINNFSGTNSFSKTKTGGGGNDRGAEQISSFLYIFIFIETNFLAPFFQFDVLWKFKFRHKGSQVYIVCRNCAIWRAVTNKIWMNGEEDDDGDEHDDNQNTTQDYYRQAWVREFVVQVQQCNKSKSSFSPNHPFRWRACSWRKDE